MSPGATSSPEGMRSETLPDSSRPPASALVHGPRRGRLVEAGIPAALPGERGHELAHDLEELVEVACHEELRLHPRDVVRDLRARDAERELANLRPEAADRLPDRREQAGPVQAGRVERPDETELAGPPVETARAHGLRRAPHARGRRPEPLLGERHLLRCRGGVLLGDGQGADRLEHRLVLRRGDGAEPGPAGGLEEVRVDGVGDERRVPGALVHDVGRGRVLDVLVSADVRRDGEHAPALELREYGGRDESANRDGRPARAGELHVHLVYGGDALDLDPRGLEAREVPGMGDILQMGREPPQYVAPHGVVARGIGRVVLRHDEAAQVRRQRRHGSLARCHDRSSHANVRPEGFRWKPRRSWCGPPSGGARGPSAPCPPPGRAI